MHSCHWHYSMPSISALTLLVEQQLLKISVIRRLFEWNSVQMICTCFRVQVLTTATAVVCCCSKTQNSLIVWYRLTQIVMEYWPLSKCNSGKVVLALFASGSAGTRLILLGERGTWGTGIRGLMRGMATLPKGKGNQELLVVRDKVGRPQVSLG